MKLTACVVLTVATLVVTPLSRAQVKSASADSVAGRYEGTAANPLRPNDSVALSLNLVLQDGKISGRIATPEVEAQITTGTFTQNRLEIRFNVGGAPGTLDATLSRDGAMTGKWTLAGQGGTVELKRVPEDIARAAAMIDQARDELRASKPAGDAAVQRTASKWADELWSYHADRPASPEASRARREALLMLLDSGQVSAALSKTSSLAPNDRTLDNALDLFFRNATRRGQLEVLISTAGEIAAQSGDAKTKARAEFMLGEALWQKSENVRAKECFEKSLAYDSKGDFSAEARGNIYEIDRLNVGQAAPALIARALDGTTVSLTKYSGRPVLIVFWATW